MLAGPALDASTSGRVGQTYEEASTFMRSLGFENSTETMRILDIAMNPNSLYLDRKRSINSNVRSLLPPCMHELRHLKWC